MPVPAPAAAPVAAAAAPASVIRPQAGTSGEEVAVGFDGIPLLPAAPDRSLALMGASPIASFEPARTLQLVNHELRGIELIAFDPSEQAEQSQARFNVAGRTDSMTAEELQRTLRSSMFSGQLDRLRSEVQEELHLDKSVTISVAGVSLGLSLVYVLWLIRGGVLMGSYLSALPAWRVLDPLPVLSRVDEETDEDDEALDAVAEGSGNPLRRFG